MTVTVSSNPLWHTPPGTSGFWKSDPFPVLRVDEAYMKVLKDRLRFKVAQEAKVEKGITLKEIEWE